MTRQNRRHTNERIRAIGNFPGYGPSPRSSGIDWGELGGLGRKPMDTAADPCHRIGYNTSLSYFLSFYFASCLNFVHLDSVLVPGVGSLTNGMPLALGRRRYGMDRADRTARDNNERELDMSRPPLTHLGNQGDLARTGRGCLLLLGPYDVFLPLPMRTSYFPWVGEH
jgi:hypothetical protein